MPEFILNETRPSKAYDSLSDFAKGYVEAMFFTNGDTGDNRENLLNDLGVERLTKKSIAAIVKDCAAFCYSNQVALNLAYALNPGSYGGTGFDAARAGRCFWFVRQGHGVDWLDNYAPAESPECLVQLSESSKAYGETYVEVHRGWIHCK
jgi:hypothetical protein